LPDLGIKALEKSRNRRLFPAAANLLQKTLFNSKLSRDYDDKYYVDKA
jgi:hypothetical protein